MADVSAAVDRLAEATLMKFAIAVLIGIGVGAMASPDPVTIPAVGTLPSLYIGGAVAMVGIGLWIGLDRYSSSDCGCGGDCGC